MTSRKNPRPGGSGGRTGTSTPRKAGTGHSLIPIHGSRPRAWERSNFPPSIGPLAERVRPWRSRSPHGRCWDAATLSQDNSVDAVLQFRDAPGLEQPENHAANCARPRTGMHSRFCPLRAIEHTPSWLAR